MNNQMKANLICAQVKGMRLDAAKNLASQNGLKLRVTSDDGIQFYGSADLDMGRINVEVIDGIIRESHLG